MDFFNRSPTFLFWVLFVTLILIIFLFPYAKLWNSFQGIQNDSFASNTEACIDVEGYVLGNISSNATVYLYQTPSPDLESVLKTVRTDLPYQTALVNNTKEFKFICLIPGQYIVSIPAVDYLNHTVGSPLPYEIVTDNFSVAVAYQGGNHKYLLGGFNISRVIHENES